MENLWAFVVASVVLIVIPGPSVLFVIGLEHLSATRGVMMIGLGGVLALSGNKH